MNICKDYETLLANTEQIIEQESLFYPEFFQSQTESDEDDIFTHCKTCNLSNSLSLKNRGVGSNNPILMIISDKPEQISSSTYRSFDMESGMLFTKMLTAMNISNNLLQMFKCRFSKFQLQKNS